MRSLEHLVLDYPMNLGNKFLVAFIAVFELFLELVLVELPSDYLIFLGGKVILKSYKSLAKLLGNVRDLICG